MLTTLQAVTIGHFETGKRTHAQARRIAGKMFDEAYDHDLPIIGFGEWTKKRQWEGLRGPDFKAVKPSDSPGSGRE